MDNAACVLRLWCSECSHVQAALMCRTCASYCHTSYMRNMYATCVHDMCCLHTCMLKVCCTSVSCMYAYYYSAAYMPLAHMQATSVSQHDLLAYMHTTTVLHTHCLHTCRLLVFLICAACIHAYYYSAAYMPLAHMQATSIPHMSSLHTCILPQCCIHAASHIINYQ